MPSRKPLYNAFLQNDLEGTNFNIRSLNAVDALAGSTVFVDQSLPTEIGKIGSTMAFKSLQAALSAAPANYSIVIRPGTYLWDGIISITRSHIKIYGEGVTISPTTPGEQAGLKITSNFVELHGLTFDGLLTGSPSNTGATIEVGRATNVTLDRIRIKDQHGHGILLTDFWSSFEARDCSIDHCQIGVTSTLIDDVNDVTISGSNIQDCRQGGVIIIGDSNAHLLRQIRISNNTINNCDTSGANAPSIEVSGGASDVLVHGNYCARSYYGITLGQVRRAEVTANNVFGTDVDMLRLVGCQTISASSNVMDGSSPSTGNPHSTVGISMTGDYAIANDSGPYSITGNLVSGIDPSGVIINLANADSVSLVGNQFSSNAEIYLSAFQNVIVASNLFIVTGSSPAISLDTGDRGWIGLTISGNRFSVPGSPTRLIATHDDLSFGSTNLHVTGNTSSIGKVYSNGIVSAVSGALPLNISLKSNSPKSTTRTASGYDARYGWVNDDMPELAFATLFVSKLTGSDSTGTREAKTLPFLTINAAITAASANDVVLVVDGVFNELIAAKNGVTVRFLPTAKLLCSTVGGCIQTSAVSQLFYVYHEHTPMVCSSGVSAILMNHVGAYISIHGSITNTGTGGSVHYVVQGFDGTLEVWGNLSNEDSLCIGNGTGSGSDTLNVILHSVDSNPILRSDSTAAVDCTALQLVVHGGTINGTNGVKIYPETNGMVFEGCIIHATSSTQAPINFGTASANFLPIFRNCVLVAGSTATASMIVGSAQTVLLYGETVANKGANPPTNVTFAGGGTYEVDAAVTAY